MVGDVDSGADECHLAEPIDSDPAEDGEQEERYVVERRTLRTKMGGDVDPEDAKRVTGVLCECGVAVVVTRVLVKMGMDRENRGI